MYKTAPVNNTLQESAFYQLVLTSTREAFRDLATGLVVITLVPIIFTIGAVLALTLFKGSIASSGDNLAAPIVTGTLCASFSMLMVSGSATALVALRSRGTLRLLSTTPVSSRLIFTSLLPIRLLVSTGVLLTLVILAILQNSLSFSGTFGLILTSFVGIGMFSALGFFLGARTSSVEACSLICTVTVTAMWLIGIQVASEPSGVMYVIGLINPLSYLADAMFHAFKTTTAHPIWVDYSVMVGTTIVLALAAIRTMRSR
jgi:ABC-2 type transport system permease protein